MNVFITSAVPAYCAYCGESTRLKDSPRYANGIDRQGDYLAGASHQCRNCGALYQLAPRAAIIQAAANGDLAQYVK